MKRAAVLFADGFEEIEGLTVVDVLRRVGVGCDIIGVTGKMATGSHGVTITADKELGDLTEQDFLRDYDLLVLPGGLPGAENLRDEERVIGLVRAFDGAKDKYLAAICAAPIVFGKAGLTAGRRVTSYPDEGLKSQLTGAEYADDEIVVVDGRMVTSRGPATALAFAYTLVNLLGIDSTELEKKMLYRS